MSDLSAALRRRWWLVLAGIVVAAVPAYAIASDRPDEYASEVRLVVGPAVLEEELVGAADSAAALDRGTIPTTLAEVATGTTVFESAADAAGVKRARRNYTVESAVLPETNVVEIQVIGPDPGFAQLLGEEVTRATVKRFSEIYPIYTADVLDTASLPDAPVGPAPIVDASVAGIVGAFAGVGLALATRNAGAAAVDARRRKPGMPSPATSPAGGGA